MLQGSASHSCVSKLYTPPFLSKCSCSHKLTQARQRPFGMCKTAVEIAIEQDKQTAIDSIESVSQGTDT